MSEAERHNGEHISYIERHIIVFDKVLRSLKFPRWLACALILLQFLQVIIIMVDHESFAEGSALASIIHYSYLLVPHKYITDYNILVYLLIMLVTVILLLVIFYLYFFIQKIKAANVLQYYGLMVYAFQYNLSMPIIGCLANVYSLPNDWSIGLSLCFKILSGLLLIIVLSLFV